MASIFSYQKFLFENGQVDCQADVECKHELKIANPNRILDRMATRGDDVPFRRYIESFHAFRCELSYRSGLTTSYRLTPDISNERA